MRSYGIDLCDLEFERGVKVGSVKYKIDIAVNRNGTPWLVVECKKPSETNHDRGIEQALSYANAEDVRAEFAVYTNGTVWIVRRRVSNRWIGVPDIPISTARENTEPIAHLLVTLKELQPLLYQLGQQTAGKVAARYLGAMQRFFHGPNHVTLRANSRLLHATDNLLRVLAAPSWDSYYRMDKTSAAYAGFEQFAAEVNLGSIIPPFGNSKDLRVEMLHLHAALANAVEGCAGLASIDALILRLCVTLTEYGMKLGLSGKVHPEIEPQLHQALHTLLDFGLRVHLNVCLPDSIDRIWQGDVREYCRTAWETFDKDPHELSAWSMLGMMIAQPFRRLAFWRDDRQ